MRHAVDLRHLRATPAHAIDAADASAPDKSEHEFRAADVGEVFVRP